MSKQRLIDVNALVDKVRTDWGLTHQSQMISATTKLAAADAMCKLLGEVVKLSTVDAVQVVRCEDCVCSFLCNGLLRCSRIAETTDRYYRGKAEVVMPDDYCSRGIPKKAKPLDGGESE